MNQLTSKQRKLVYLGGIVLLIIPVIWLGMPATSAEDSGGQLAQLRQQHDLGEVSLGNVDPTSSTMNLVLLGLRGIAADLLWMQAIEQKETKNWGALRATVDSIIMLQPHFMKVWRYQGWNLAFNVSVEWDAVPDRWFWVKEGGKFMQRGSRRNERYPELKWDVGNRILSEKIGRSDEWRFFREYFKVDPDVEQFGENNTGDPALNTVDGQQFDDNYLAARQWYLKACAAEETQPQHQMQRMLFRSYPARAYLDYANGLQRDGIFDEKAIYGWQQAFDAWTQEFGKEYFQAPGGWLYLEANSQNDIEQMIAYNAEKDIETDEELLRKWLASYQNRCNYRYWRERAESESEQLTADAHREIYQGQELFKQGRVGITAYRAAPGVCEDLAGLNLPEQHLKLMTILCEAGEPVSHSKFRDAAGLSDRELNEALRPLVYNRKLVQPVSEAQLMLESGMAKLEQVLEQHPLFESEDGIIEEALTAVLYWRYAIVNLNELPLPQDYPLEDLWELHQDRVAQIEADFKRENSLQ